jgi:hypothetical protein
MEAGGVECRVISDSVTGLSCRTGTLRGWRPFHGFFPLLRERFRVALPLVGDINFTRI